jgi:hypothetical protein
LIVLSRAQVRLFRSVLRRSVVEQVPRGEWPLVLCEAGEPGLRLSALRGDVGLCYREAGERTADTLVFRSSVLQQIEGRTPDPVTLEQAAPGKGRARWDEGAVPRVVDFETVTADSAPTLPRAPSEWAAMPDGFLTVMDEATQTTAKESGRFALSRIQIKGRAGQVVATDGKALLIQGGFRFPWSDDLLVPRVSAFGLRELAEERPVAIGRTERHVAVRAGRWTFWLAIDTSSRYPDAQTVVPRPSAGACRLSLNAADAAFLAQALPKLPGQDDDHSPVTFDLGRKALVRARAQGGDAVTEVELSRSRVEGSATLCIDRTILRRALQLGFVEVLVCKPDTPLLFRDSRRVFVTMPLDRQSALAPSPDAVRIASPVSGPSPTRKPSEQPPRGRRSPTMPASHASNDPPSATRGNGAPAEGGPSLTELIAEAETLRASVQESSARLTRLIAGLKQHKRASLAMRAAVQSLRQLKLDG